MNPQPNPSLEVEVASGLIVQRDGPVLRVRLNRPEVHNALNGELVAQLLEVLLGVEDGGSTRVLVLSGEGPSFCAGADLSWMRTLSGLTREQHAEDAKQLFDMLSALNGCPVPTVARVHGAALGGGMGLLAACDVVVAAASARFGFTEAKLGLLPAVISPFCVAKIGGSHARALFTTAERFDAARAMQIGLVHRIAPEAELDAAIEAVTQELLTSAPGAASHARGLVTQVAGKPPAEVRGYVAEINARRRVSPEGQEGMAAFLEKRKPSWTVDG